MRKCKMKRTREEMNEMRRRKMNIFNIIVGMIESLGSVCLTDFFDLQPYKSECNSLWSNKNHFCVDMKTKLTRQGYVVKTEKRSTTVFQKPLPETALTGNIGLVALKNEDIISVNATGQIYYSAFTIPLTKGITVQKLYRDVGFDVETYEPQEIDLKKSPKMFDKVKDKTRALLRGVVKKGKDYFYSYVRITDKGQLVIYHAN